MISTRGRPDIQTGQQYTLGVDVGGTSIKSGLVSATGIVIALTERATPTARVDIIECISDVLSDALANPGVKETRLVGIGIGMPGVFEDGVIVGAIDNIRVLKGVDLAHELAGSAKIPIQVGNDADCMALAEWRFGAARDLENAVLLTIGTGIGGALIINGRLFNGHRSRGAELGHISVQLNGLPCTCGAKGCLETYASTTALLSKYRDLVGSDEPRKFDGRVLIRRYRLGDAAAMEALNWHLDYLSNAIAGFINIFNPQKVIVGGGIAESGPFYIREIRVRVSKVAMPEALVGVEIVPAQLGNSAGFIGAAVLSMKSCTDQLSYLAKQHGS